MDVGAFVHRRIAGSRLRVIEATGHCPHVSHPAETIGAIRAYLAERAPARRVAIP
jgi:sigma-B regulation protein RsbQ